MLRRWGCAATIGALSAACRPAAAPSLAQSTPSVHSADALKPEAPKYETLPRLERIWSRPGLGRYGGTISERVYYTVANDGASVHAVDLTSGKTLWQTPLATPVKDKIQANVVGSALVLIYPPEYRGGDTDIRIAGRDSIVARLAADTGSLHWSKRVPCSDPSGKVVDGRFYLSCPIDIRSREVVLQELDLAKGSEIARVTLTGTFELIPGGGVCGISSNAIWCGKIAGNRLEVAWSQPAPGSEYAQLSAAAGILIVHGFETIARRVSDGRVVWTHRWERRGRSMPLSRDAQRLLFVGEESIEIVRLADGATLAQIAVPHDGFLTPFSDGERILIAPNGEMSNVVYLVDAQSRVRALAKSAGDLSHAGGGVALAERAILYGVNTKVESLDAYSLTQFAPAQELLAPHDQVVSVLERYYFNFMEKDAVPAIQPIPGWTTSLQTIIATGPAELSGPAIVVAGRSHDPSFLLVLRGELERFTSVPEGRAEQIRFEDVVHALASLWNPEAPAALLSYWQRIGYRLAKHKNARFLRPYVLSAIWSHGASRDYLKCKDVVFPSLRVPPDRATLGTVSPGAACAVDPERRWAAIYEARKDDDGNGKLEVPSTGFDGDELSQYLVLGSGPGTPIDDFIGADPLGRWIVVAKDMCVYLVDAESGKATALKGADGRPGDPVSGGHRAASFSPDGKNMVYLKSEGDRATVVRRELATGREQRIDPGRGDLNGVFFDASSRFVVMDFVSHDLGFNPAEVPPLLGTTYRRRGCRGSALFATNLGPNWNRPFQRFASLADGRVHDVREGKVLQPVSLPEPKFELGAASGAAAGGRDAPLPRGPFRWQPKAAGP